MVQSSDGGFVTVGVTIPDDSDNGNIYIVKTDSEGVEEWSKILGDDGFDQAYCIQSTTDGGYVVAGMRCGETSTAPPVWKKPLA